MGCGERPLGYTCYYNTHLAAEGNASAKQFKIGARTRQIFFAGGSMAMEEQLVLGLDIGVASVGWALVRFVDNCQTPVGVKHVGVRRFETGTDGGEAGIEKGKDESRAAARRTARGQRRLLDRRSQRTANTLRHLQSGGLLPAGRATRGDARHDYIRSLDAELMVLTLQRLLRRQAGLDALTAAQMVATRFPYLLRAAALDEPLSSYELGRIFLHLSQRRGFKSNRKEAHKLALADQERAGEKARKAKAEKADKSSADADDPKATLDAIESLREKMKTTNAPTLGAYLSGLNPHKQRIRTLRTSRDMFETEFEKIVEAQASRHAILRDDEFLRRLRHALFFQRSLKSARRLRNKCELMSPRRCVARASLSFQRYRMVTEVNNLRVVEATGEVREMSSGERKALYAALSDAHHLTLIQAREKAGLPKGAKWTIELDKQLAKGKRLPGEALGGALRKVAPHWWTMAQSEEREKLVAALRGAETNEKLVAALRMEPWGFDEDTARAIAAVPLEEGYGAYSRSAISKLLPLLEDGKTLPAAIKSAFPETKSIEACDLLPPIVKALGDLRNPAVMRSLTELRKVVNHIVRRYGKPDLIRVELARDLKRGRQERMAIFRNNQDRQAEYDKFDEAARAKVPSLPPGRLSRRDRVKWALAEECGWICPYTGGTHFTPHDLFNGVMEIEHIIPRSQHGDDGFNNLTLCRATENAVKSGRTPFEAYGHDEAKYREILSRVGRFKGRGAAVKLEAFNRRDTSDELFAMRHLNDTRYISRLAVRYLGHLYGFVDDPTRARAIDPLGRLRVQSNTGGLTDLLRRKWQLMRVMDKLLRAHPGAPVLPTVLSNEERDELNKRVDHRHHAMDAVVVALTTPAFVNQLANIAREAELKKLPHDRLPPIPDPWAGFLEEVENALSRIVVSQRPDRRINGPLHKATNYSRPITSGDGKLRTHLRVPINDSSLRPAKIPDKGLREAVERKLGHGKPDKTFDPSRPETLPVVGNDSGVHPVKRVRVEAFDKTSHLRKLGGGYGTRYVLRGGNNHLVIYQVLDEMGQPQKDRKGQSEFGWKLCPTVEAMDRLRKREAIVQVPANCKLVAEVRRGDYFQLTDDNDLVGLYVVDNISDGDIQLRLAHLLPDKDARKIECGRPRIASVRAWIAAKPRKMSISVLGEVTEPHGSVPHG
jgi:CRISPR-associated endonuclease Csn1